MTSDNLEQIKILAENAKSGNRTSMEQLVDIYHRDVFRMVFYRTRSKMDAEDITQEIFIKMVNSIHGLKDPLKFKSWLFSIAINKVRDYYRKRKMLGLLGMNPDQTENQPDMVMEDQLTYSPDKNLLDREFQDRLSDFLGELSRWEKEVFILRFINQLKIREVAATLKKSESTIKTCLYRALKKLSRNYELRDLLKGEPI